MLCPAAHLPWVEDMYRAPKWFAKPAPVPSAPSVAKIPVSLFFTQLLSSAIECFDPDLFDPYGAVRSRSDRPSSDCAHFRSSQLPPRAQARTTHAPPARNGSSAVRKQTNKRTNERPNGEQTGTNGEQTGNKRDSLNLYLFIPPKKQQTAPSPFFPRSLSSPDDLWRAIAARIFAPSTPQIPSIPAAHPHTSPS